MPNFSFIFSHLNFSVIRLSTLDIQRSHFFKRVAWGEDNAVFAELIEIVFDLDRRGDELVDSVGLGLFIAFQYGALIEYFAEHFNAFFYLDAYSLAYQFVTLTCSRLVWSMICMQRAAMMIGIIIKSLRSRILISSNCKKSVNS